MPVITMKVPCSIQTKAGNDLYGQPTFSAPRKTVCAVVTLLRKSQKTTVRTDSSGTRGHADESVSEAVLLFKKTEEIAIDDFIDVRGLRLTVTGIQYRYNVLSVLDHLEITAGQG